MTLTAYHKKRNFSKTPEPKGKVTKTKGHLYVIQKHAASHLHYDFRLELNGVLLSWAVPKGPCLDPSVKRLAMHVEDHPVDYGHFEGIIPQGEYGGGTVMLWDEGTWIPEDPNPTAAYRKGHLSFVLKGKKLKGRWSLIKFKSAGEKSWFLLKSKDKYAQSLDDYDITEVKPNSVLTKQSIEEIAETYQSIWSKTGLKKVRKKKVNITSTRKFSIPKLTLDLRRSKFPEEIFPELATLVDKPPQGDQWLHEIKLDGYRMLSFITGNSVRLMSRNNHDWTMHFNRVVKELKKFQNTNIIFDGEVVLLNKEGKSNFQLLQNSIKKGESQPFIYYIFDLLYIDHYNLMDLTLLERKKILEKIIPTDNEILRYSDHIVGHGEEVFKKACELTLEGIVSKKIDSCYEKKRTKNWLKIKCVKRQEFVVGGYSPPSGARKYFGSLYLGVYNNKKEFIYCGNVGTGFNEASLKDIYTQLQKYKTNQNPFNCNPPGVTSAIWVKPCLIVEVEFSEFTDEGSIRHPSFKGIRKDKKPKEVTLEKEKSISTIQRKVRKRKRK